MSITPETPQSRNEKWLAVIAGIEGIEPEEPQSRIEKWLAYIAEHGTGSLTHETWTFTLEDGSTVEKEVTLWT